VSLALRVAVIVAMLIAARQWLVERQPLDVPLSKPLASFPWVVNQWRGADGGDIDPEIARNLGADDYLNRVYSDTTGAIVGLYVAYYGSQRQGDAIHSPLHCLPGSGWTPVVHSRQSLDVGTGRIPINHYIVEKAGTRHLVLYWFQGRGRVVANEYANKAYLLVDAFRLRRTDEALVRIVAPIDDRGVQGISTQFVQALFPFLTRWLP
jgi:EpsI family protein